MTYAICIKCGHGKLGAFTPCTKCGFVPESRSDQARSMILCDHNADRATLDAAGAQLRAGQPLTYDEAGVEKMAAEFEEFAKHMPPGFGRGCAVFGWMLTGIIVALLAMIIASIWYVRSHRP